MRLPLQNHMPEDMLIIGTFLLELLQDVNWYRGLTCVIFSAQQTQWVLWHLL